MGWTTTGRKSPATANLKNDLTDLNLCSMYQTPDSNFNGKLYYDVTISMKELF